MTVNDASLGGSGSKLSKVAATSLVMGVTRGSSDAYTTSRLWIQPTDSGNLHMYAIIDGKKRRRVFTEKNKKFGKVLRLMYEHLDEARISEVIEEYFISGRH